MPSPIWVESKSQWVVRIQKDGIRRSFTSTTPGNKGRKEVLKKLSEFESFGDNTHLLVSAAYDRYLEEVEAKHGRRDTYRQIEGYGRLYIKPAIGKMQVKNVTLYDLQRIINTAKPKRHVETLSKKSLKNLRACLTGFMKYCVNNYYCDPLRGELYIPVGHPTVGKDILQPDEIRKLFEPCDLWYYNAFLTMLLCGLRPGELLGLKRSDVQGRILLVNRAINGSNEITPGKNKNAHRAVPMPELAYRIIQDTIKRNDELRLNTEWVFCGYNGEAGNQCALRRQWIKLKQEKGLSDRIKLYSLRHTFVSIVSAQTSISEGNLRQIIGHGKTMDTLGVYGHRVDNELENTATLIDLTFNRYRNTM